MRPLQKFRHKWQHNRMHIKEIDVNARNWVDSAQDRCGIQPPVSINNIISLLLGSHSTSGREEEGRKEGNDGTGYILVK